MRESFYQPITTQETIPMFSRDEYEADLAHYTALLHSTHPDTPWLYEKLTERVQWLRNYLGV